jgi:hypothetical protein
LIWICLPTFQGTPCYCRLSMGVQVVSKACQWLTTGRWFSPGTPVSSTNKTDRHNVTEILLKVELNTMNHKTKQKVRKLLSFLIMYLDRFIIIYISCFRVFRVLLLFFCAQSFLNYFAFRSFNLEWRLFQKRCTCN